MRFSRGSFQGMVACALLLVGLTGCEIVNLNDKEDAPQGGAPGTSAGAIVGGAGSAVVDPAQAIFATTVFPVINSQLNCSLCHGVQVPRITGNVTVAWNAIVVGNWIQEGLPPANNPLTIQVNGHNGNGRAEAATVAAAIGDWQNQMSLIPTIDLVDYGEDSLIYDIEAE